MHGSYRRIIIAAVGWLILTGQTGQPRHNNTATEAQAEQGLNNIAAAIEHANKPEKSDPGCDPRKEDRHSDLCAQWKAADAARNSFVLGIFGAAIGFATLLAAGFAAMYAKEAALHTQAGAEAAKEALAHARLISDAELRPYLFIEKMEMKDVDPDFSSLKRVEAVLKNYGITPARNIRCKMFVYLAGNSLVPRPFHRSVAWSDTGSAAPGHYRRSLSGIVISEEDAKKIVAFESYLVVRIRYTYTDQGGQKFTESVDYYMDGISWEDRDFYLLTAESINRKRRREPTLFDAKEPSDKKGEDDEN